MAENYKEQVDELLAVVKRCQTEIIPSLLDEIDELKSELEKRVEVVRCKDCDNWEESVSAGRASLGTLVCMCQERSDVEGGYYRYTRPNEFCSRGERKENGD